MKRCICYLVNILKYCFYVMKMKFAGIGLGVLGAWFSLAWADGYFVSGDYTRPGLKDEAYKSHVTKALSEYWQDYHFRPGTQNREKVMEVVRQYPNEINDLVYDHGGSFSALGVAVRCNDYELVRFLLEQGAVPIFDTWSEMQKLLSNNGELDARIVEALNNSLNNAKIQEACLKSRLLPDIDPWAYTPLHQYHRPMPEAAGWNRGFSRLPDPAVWVDEERVKKSYTEKVNILVLEGLREAEGKFSWGDNVDFVRMGLGLSEDGRLMAVQISRVREGRKGEVNYIARYHISLVPYVFTIPRKDGKVSVISFSREAKQVRHIVLGQDGQVEASELLYPRAPEGREYRQPEKNADISIEGFELPAWEVLTEL